MASTVFRALPIALRHPCHFCIRPSPTIAKHLIGKWPNPVISRTSSNGICSTIIPEVQVFNEKHGLNIQSYKDLHDFSLRDPALFWGTLAKSRLDWYREFDQVMNCDFTKGKIAWFQGGQLNVTVNCVDRHKDRTPDKIALIWEKDEPNMHETLTYKELYELMNQFANVLKNHGVLKGDRVCIYMPVSPLSVAAMLACARIGAVHSVVFAGFSAEALGSRIRAASSEVVITTDQGVRGGKIIDLKKTVDAAVASCPTVKKVFVTQRTGAEVPMGELDIPVEAELAGQPTECNPEIMDSEDMLFMLYTSGSTGQPKGLVHTQAGYLLYAGFTHQTVFDYQEDDIFACVADIGWITGHSYVVYGPLFNGATTVLFESIPTYPDPGRYWEMVERLKVNQLYCAPTAIRLLLKSGEKHVNKYDRSSLKTIGSVGEPLNHEAWEWYYNVVGQKRCTLVDTWWQTETGGILISPRPSEPFGELRLGPMRALPGIELVLMHDMDKEMKGNDAYGALCVRTPWPGIARTVYGDHQRYIDTYFKTYPGLYFSGDGAHRDHYGYYLITGRMDDVINVSGHRLGTAEVEDAMDEHPAVAETAVVGFPHDIKGEGVYAYVTLKDDIEGEPEEQIMEELKELVRQQIASYAVPEMIQVAPGLPKTRSGKIMRRILRKIAANEHEDLGDITTLAEPNVVEAIVKNHDVIMEQRNKHLTKKKDSLSS